MYKAKRKLTKEQLIFIAELIFDGAMDAINSRLPPNYDLPYYSQHQDEIDTFQDGTNRTLGMQLAILIAQITGSGCGIFDWAQTNEWFELVNNHVTERTNPDWKEKPGDTCYPDCRHIAEQFVEQNFTTYDFAKDAR